MAVSFFFCGNTNREGVVSSTLSKQIEKYPILHCYFKNNFERHIKSLLKTKSHINFDNSYSRLPGQFYTRQNPVPVSAPSLIRINHTLAEEARY